MSKLTLDVQRFPQEGDLTHSYYPLLNVIDSEGKIKGFTTKDLGVDLNHPVSIECQPSYDGTVNLLLNDDKNPPRIINTRFSKLEDNRFKIINRNQIQQTNLYKEDKIDQQTRLFRNVENIPKIDLFGIYNTGQLKGGNYTFYIKYADEDYNKTDIVSESGQISVFKGQIGNPKSISGTLLNELTDKAITLKISNLDRAYSKIYIYFSRETSDTNGIRMSSAGMINKAYDIKSSTEFISITGYEEIKDISIEELNIQYNTVSAAKAHTQVQNMYFLGNVQGTVLNIKDLQNISYFIDVSLHQSEESIGWVNPANYSIGDNDTSQAEYYSPTNIYYKLGYWPDEMYRLGIVYIMSDDTLSPVFNLRGHMFTELGESNITSNTNLYKDSKKKEMNYLERDTFLKGGGIFDNTFGVFKNPKETSYDNNKNTTAIIDYLHSTVKPWYYKISLGSEVAEALKTLKVKGFFIVRQKRYPTILCQGLSVGVDSSSYIPMLYYNNKYFSESFKDKSGLLSPSFENRKVETSKSQCSGILSIDANMVPTLKSTFDGSNFVMTPSFESGNLFQDTNKRHFYFNGSSSPSSRIDIGSVVYVGSDTPLKYINGYSFSTKCGSPEEVNQFSFFGGRDTTINGDLVRGLYCPFLGTTTNLINNTIYNIKVPNFTNSLLKNYFQVRGTDISPFFAITDRVSLDGPVTVDAYRGDCYTNTVTIRLNRNFIDSEVPVNEIIMDSATWKDNYKGYNKMVNGWDSDKKLSDDMGDYANMNRADINTVPLGMWVTFKCLSNYNLGLRSINPTNTEEYALMGSPRSFYPVSDMTTNVSHKVEESWILNQGYSATVGQKRNFIAENVPYTKELFDNRVMFSKTQAYGDFQNSYRIFQSLDYADIDRQYGAIVKMIPWDSNILCIFEHGIGEIPINEKALISTQSGQPIHMYGAGVLQNQVNVISPDFGSIWVDSIVKTPIGVYGVDTYAKKIWRVSKSKGIETISDMKVQKFLNDNINLLEADKYPIVGVKNVKSHYNNYKGDVMFTFYNEDNGTSWNLCFNERMDKWITRYSWSPLYSENIDNVFYSLDHGRVKVLGNIYNNKNCQYGIRTDNNLFSISKSDDKFSTKLSLNTEKSNKVTYEIVSLETEYLDQNSESRIIKYTENDLTDIPFKIKEKESVFYLESLPYNSESPVGMKQWFKSQFGIDYIPLYYNIGVKATIEFNASLNGTVTSAKSSVYDTIGVVIEINPEGTETVSKDYSLYETNSKYFLKNGFYVHGKAGVFDEIDYTDNDAQNEILPTKWYDRQEPFELEFVVNDQLGAHKIFNNLVIISNNVQPNEIEYELEGDVYSFNKVGIFKNEAFNTGIWNTKYTKQKWHILNPTTKKFTQTTQDFKNCSIKWDNTLNSYSILVKQPVKNIKEYGLRTGNIQYKEDSWYLTIDPIKYSERVRSGLMNYNSQSNTWIDDINSVKESIIDNKSVKLRDKYIKIRVKYTGRDLVIITALKTLLTLSYA